MMARMTRMVQSMVTVYPGVEVCETRFYHAVDVVR